MDNKLVKLGAVWINVSSKTGEEFYAGKLDAKIIMFPNKYKNSENQPDFLLYVQPYQKRNDDDGGYKKEQPKYNSNNSDTKTDPEQQKIDDEEIPF